MASSTVFAVTSRRMGMGSARSATNSVTATVTATVVTAIGSSVRCVSSATNVLSSSSNSAMHPNYSIDSIKPPKYWGKPEDAEEDPNYYHRKPVSSAHAIDLTSTPPKLSAKDSAAISPNGTVVHGRYGELKMASASGVPLEYLALLHPAAEAASALRQLNIDVGADVSKKKTGSGTLLIYGATQAAGLAALQLASSANIAVLGVVDGTHSSQHEFVDEIKNITLEPGTVLPEETACIKTLFRELVQGCTNGDAASNMTSYDASTFLRDFRENVLDYVKYYPESQLSSNPADYEFDGKEKDRKHHKANITAYLSQFDKGAPEIDPVIFKESFTVEQYAIFKNKFHRQTTAVISGDGENSMEKFSPADIVRDMALSPESIANELPAAGKEGGEYVPYEFTPLTNCLQNGVEVEVGGPVLGAVVNVTADLSVAVEAVAKGKTLREKAEALQFLTDGQKNAYAGFSSVVGAAKEAGKPVVVVGGTLPNFSSVEPSPEDVEEALSAMALSDDESQSRLNYFLQIYRASDYPVYADYAIHRAMEPLAGPRQIVVTK